jgi:hypothetical protein
VSGPDHRQRLQRISRAVTAASVGGDAVGALCRAAVDVVEVAGASTMVMSDGIAHPLCASDRIAARLEELQQTLGEGPCVDAHASGSVVYAPHLAALGRSRWTAFGPAAAAAGAAAIFSYPLRVGGVRLGALTVYQRGAGDLSADQHADARTMASVVMNAILAIQARAAPGALGPELELLAGDRAELHQAAGMVSGQLGVEVRA